MRSSPGTNELREGKVEYGRFYERLWRKQISRRRAIKIGALASTLGISGAVQALIAACGGEEQARPPATGTPSGATATPSTFAGITGDWDTTGTPPYKRGLPDDVANIPEKWKQYPWVYKYSSHFRYNWDVPVTRGGHLIVPWGPPADYNIMVNGIQAQPTNNKLYNAALREGVNLMTASIEPDLAIHEEHNEDFTTWTFQIPENVKFHNIPPVNGRKLTAADVAFSFERHRDTSVFKSILRNVEKITAVDERTIRFDLKQPQISFRETLAAPHFSVFAPEHFEDQDLFKRQPIGTGPFILEFSEYQNRGDWVRNPEYWQLPPIKREKYGNAPLPFVDKFTRQYFANNVAAKEAFFAGKVDQFQPGCGLDTALVREQLQRVPDAIVNTNAYWSCCPSVLMMNFKNPLFQDIRVRRALSMGMNREQIWSGGMDKTGVVGAAPIPFDFYVDDYFPPPSSEYGPNAQYNPEQAKQLLREAGLTPPIRLQIYQTPNQPAAWQGSLDTIVFNWKQAGVAEAELVVRDALVWNQDRLNRTWPDLLYTCCGLISGYELNSLVAPTFLPDSPANYGSVDDPVLTDLLEKLLVLTDPNEIPKLARQMADQIVENVDHLWFTWIQGIEIDHPWLHGMVMSNHNCVNGIGWGNYKYVWMGENAPDGRGGKPI